MISRYKWKKSFESQAGVLDIVLALPGHLGWNNMNLVLDERAKATGYFESEPDFVTDPTNNYLREEKLK